MEKKYDCGIEIIGDEKECIEYFCKIVDDIENHIRYDEFFFTTEEKNNTYYMKIYFTEDCYKRLDISSSYNDDSSIKDIAVKHFQDDLFNETNGRFGEKGNYILSEFYKIVNRKAIDLVRNTKSDYSVKLINALEILIASAHWNYKGIENGYISFASHVNGFFTRWENMDRIRAVFNEKYLNCSEDIKKMLLEVISAQYTSDNYEIYNQLKILKKEVAEAVENKELYFVDNSDDGNPDIFYRSVFHSAIEENKDFKKYMNENKEFLSSRIMTVFTYLLIKKIGVKNIDRYILAYYIYSSVEEIYGLNCIEAIKNFKYDEVLVDEKC